jgi:hypothetical protein
MRAAISWDSSQRRPRAMICTSAVIFCSGGIRWGTDTPDPLRYNVLVSLWKNCLFPLHTPGIPNLRAGRRKPSQDRLHCPDHRQPDHTHTHKLDTYSYPYFSPFRYSFGFTRKPQAFCRTLCFCRELFPDFAAVILSHLGTALQ